jgi:uncharacterized membrane protein HdeD (DUF308 family)
MVYAQIEDELTPQQQISVLPSFIKAILGVVGIHGGAESSWYCRWRLGFEVEERSGWWHPIVYWGLGPVASYLMAIESNFNQLAMSSESFIKNKLK